jgi:hypothetical protein
MVKECPYISSPSYQAMSRNSSLMRQGSSLMSPVLTILSMIGFRHVTACSGSSLRQTISDIYVAIHTGYCPPQGHGVLDHPDRSLIVSV